MISDSLQLLQNLQLALIVDLHMSQRNPRAMGFNRFLRRLPIAHAAGAGWEKDTQEEQAPHACHPIRNKGPLTIDKNVPFIVLDNRLR